MAEEKNKKIKSNFITMVSVLTIVSVFSAFALGFTYIKTKDKIAYNSQLKTLAAIKKVLPDGYDNIPADDKYVLTDERGEKLICFPAKKGQEIIGTAIRTYSDNAFNERIVLMVGLDLNQKIVDIFVCEQSETPGLGNKITKTKFLDQFKRKDPQVCHFKKGGEIDGITAATITSKAFCEAVLHAQKVLLNAGNSQ